jgi:PAS domain S-box-containing protein
LDPTGIEKQDTLDASHQVEAIFRAFPDLLFTMDEKGRILDYKAGKMSALFLPPEQFLGHPMWDVLPVEVGSRFAHAFQEAVRTGKVVSMEYRLVVPEGERWFEARVVPVNSEARVIAIVRDVSEKIRDGEKIKYQLKRLYALHAVDTAITASLDLNVTLSVILRQIINQLGADACDVLVLNPTTHMLEFAAGQGFHMMPQRLPLMIGQGHAGKAALERRTISIPDLGKHPVDTLFSSDLLQEKFTNYYAVPLIVKGQVKGVLEVYNRSILQPDDDWLDFLSSISGQTAVAIDSACLFQDLQRTNAELSLAYDAAIESWAQVLELSNRESGAHSYRVVELTIKLARSMGVTEQEIIHFRRGALLHDVGKLGISESILNKPGPLDEAEWKTMQNHPRLAYQLLSSVNYLAPALDIPHYHHERWDGSGYPCGLREEQIPFSARLFAVVDVFDALTSTRPYRPAWPRQTALDHIQKNSGILFDPMVVKTFLQVMR